MATAPLTLTPAPPTPDRSDRATFSARAIDLDNWTKNVQTPEMQALALNVYNNAQEVAAGATSASFKGAWNLLSGALDMPASVSHAGKFWLLTENLLDVTTREPGVDAGWTSINSGPGGVGSSEIQFNDGGIFTGLAAATINNATGQVTLAVGAVIQGMTVGLGGSNITTNTAFGSSALVSNTTGEDSTAIGMNALASCQTGTQNTAVGYAALYGSGAGTGTGGSNTAVGYNAAGATHDGSGNTAVGYRALSDNVSGTFNTAIGSDALGFSSGSRNTGVGHNAAINFESGDNNIVIGDSAGGDAVFDLTTESNRIVIGTNNSTNAYIKIAWTVTSDARDKTSFSPVPHGLAFVCGLTPTSYRFRKSRTDPDATGPVRYGFLAQDVLALEGAGGVVINDDDADNLKYNESSMVPILVNAIKELKAEIDSLKAGAWPL